MVGFEIVLGSAARNASPLAKKKSVLDVIVDGMNVTSRVGEGDALPFLRDLALATAELAEGRRLRASVPFYLHHDAWELGMERDGDRVFLTVFRGGSAPEVAVVEREVPGDELAQGILRALAEAVPGAAGADLEHAAETLRGAPAFHGIAPRPVSTWEIDVDEEAELGFSTTLSLREAPRMARPTVERRELFPLLMRARLHVRVRDRARDVGEVFPFLLAERLLQLSGELLAAEARREALYRRVEIGSARLAARLSSQGQFSLTVRRARESESSVGETFPGLDVPGFVQAACLFAKRLSRAVVRWDPTQAYNLRVAALRSAGKALLEELRPRLVAPSVQNTAPESYRAFALATQSRKSDRPGPLAGKLRFVPKWTAAVPAIDLGSTFLCGPKLLAQGGRELFSLHRGTGEVEWKRTVQRAVSVPTPGGLMRLLPDGGVELLDYGTGETTLKLRLSSRPGTLPSGTVVHAPGLPKLVVVTEGERHLSAVDLVSGEVRWRAALSRTTSCRVRRAGKLLVVATGDRTLLALDVLSGETVWSVSEKSPFVHAPTFDKESIYAIAGEGSRSGGHQLVFVDAWTGAVRATRPLPARGLGAPIVAGDAVMAVVRSEHGLGLSAFHRETAEPLWELSPGAFPAATAWLAVDDRVFANTDRGELHALDAATGEERYRLRLAPEGDDATPRRLEPVLVAGALFVPQHSVKVIRPSDGAELGEVPTDLVPDLLRVDELCHVYVAEESGHVAAFGVGARLSLVR